MVGEEVVGQVEDEAVHFYCDFFFCLGVPDFSLCVEGVSCLCSVPFEFCEFGVFFGVDDSEFTFC